MHVAPRAVQDSLFSISAKFTAAHRLLRENGFDHVICAENIADNQFKIFFVRNRLKNARLGIVVAKKTLHGAADRNRVKRIIRDVFRQHSIKFCNFDLVVMVRRAYPKVRETHVGSLNLLFSRVENKCADF